MAVSELELMTAVGTAENYLREAENMPRYTLIRKNGTTVDIQELPEGFYSSCEMTFRDKAGRLYKKEWHSTKVFICEPSGEPSHPVGNIDMQKLWSELYRVPKDEEACCILEDWHQFKAGTDKEVIYDWLRWEFNLNINGR